MIWPIDDATGRRVTLCVLSSGWVAEQVYRSSLPLWWRQMWGHISVRFGVGP